jgi:3-oxoacyl-[acyl-carrier-protein] synthase-3
MGNLSVAESLGDFKIANSLSKYHYLQSMQVYTKPKSRIRSIGISLPERIVTNSELVEMVKAPASLKNRLEKMIFFATRNKTRRFVEPGTEPSDLAVAASLDALKKADLSLDDIDTLIFASTDLDVIEPATANIVQKKLGLKIMNAFDVTNACNSFLQGINVANAFINTGAAKRVLVCSGEIGSYVSCKEINSLEELKIKMGGLTLGDAGAAMIIEKSDNHQGFSEINLTAMGEHWQLCHVPEDINWRKKKDGSIHGWFYLDMQQLADVARPITQEYYREYDSYRKESFKENFFMDSLGYVIPHQISRRFIEELAASTLMDIERVCVTSDVYGNTASTAIPLALHTLMEQGDLAHGSGQNVLLCGAASGFCMGHVRVQL